MKFNCGITGHTGILGSEIIKNFPKVSEGILDNYFQMFFQL